jgi:glutathione S-transferase
MTLLVALAPMVLLACYIREKRLRRTHPMSGGIHRDICLSHQQEFELYHNGLSLCSKKVRVCLRELGLPFAEHPIDLIETGSYEVVSRHFLAVNPAGLLPVLLHNGHPVYESHDIIRYCTAQAGEAGDALLPADTVDREIVDHWMDRASIKGEDVLAELDDSAASCVAVLTVPLFCSAMADIPGYRLLEGLLFHRIKLRPVMFAVFKLRGLSGLTSMEPLVNRVARAFKAMGIHLDALEDHLQSQEWICLSGFTLADISWMVIFERLEEADWLASLVGPDQRPGLWEYWKRLKGRPGYAGISQYRLPIVERATQRIRDFKTTDPLFTATLTRGGQTA